MAVNWSVPEEKVEHLSTFHGRTVHARLFVNERGQMAWEVMTWTEEEPMHDWYWIANKEIREYYGRAPDFRIGGPIVGMANKKMNILLTAIKKWESDEIEKFCS
jgi:hypothetical protein